MQKKWLLKALQLLPICTVNSRTPDHNEIKYETFHCPHYMKFNFRKAFIVTPAASFHILYFALSSYHSYPTKH